MKPSGIGKGKYGVIFAQHALRKVGFGRIKAKTSAMKRDEV